jgi:hypothetical protein
LRNIGASTCRRLLEHQTGRTKKEAYYNQNTHYMEKERILKATKQE